MCSNLKTIEINWKVLKIVDVNVMLKGNSIEETYLVFGIKCSNKVLSTLSLNLLVWMC